MSDVRLGELAALWALPDGAAEQLSRLLALVDAAAISITTVHGDQAVEVHIADSLAGLAVPELRNAEAIADLGAGGGFPGLVLAIALPQARITLVESVAKKAAFLQATAAALGLSARVAVAAERAEAWPAGVEQFDIVTARALGELPVLVEYAAPLLKIGGLLVAWKAARSPEEEADGTAAARALEMSQPQALVVDGTAVRGLGPRNLYVSSKLGPTPPGYPRRAGMARKRPHRAST